MFQISTLNSHDINERFHSTFLFLFSRHYTPINGVAPFFAYKHTHTIPQFTLKRAKTQNVSFETLYGGQLVLLTRLIILNYPVILSH